MAYSFLTEPIFIFMLIMCRLGTAFSFITAVGERYIPVTVRLFAALTFSYLMSVSGLVSYPMPSAPPVLILLVCSEVLVGLLIGVFIKIILGTIHTLGMTAAMQVGFSASHMYDPSQSTSSSTIGVLFNLIVGALIVTTDTHHHLLRIIVDSYDNIPVGAFWEYHQDAVELVLRTASDAFNLAIKLAAPFIIVGMIIYSISGVLARLTPQFQIFFLLMPLQILSGILVLLFTASGIALIFLQHFDHQVINLWSITSKNS